MFFRATGFPHAYGKRMDLRKRVYASGSKPARTVVGTRGSPDIEWAHRQRERKIVLVEAASNSFANRFSFAICRFLFVERVDVATRQVLAGAGDGGTGTGAGEEVRVP